MSYTRDEVDLLLRIAREATAGPTFAERMEHVTAALAVLVPTTSLSVAIVPAQAGDAPRHLFFRNNSLENLGRYLAHYRHADPMGPALEAPRGEPVVLSDWVRPGRYGRDAFTGEFLPRNGIRHVMGVAAALPDGSRLALALQRETGLGDFTTRERGLVGLAAADVARAAFGAVLRERPAAATPATGRLVFDARGELVGADDGALAICARLAPGSFPGDPLRPRVLALLAGVTPGPVEATWELGGDELVRARLARLAEGGRREVVVDLTWESPGERARLAAAARRFGLTARELEVATLALLGHGNRGIARALGCAEVTVNVHLGRVYRKTGAAGRGDLAGVLLGAGAGLRSPSAAAGPPAPRAGARPAPRRGPRS